MQRKHEFTSLEFSYSALAFFLFFALDTFHFCSGTWKLYQVNAYMNIPLWVGRKEELFIVVCIEGDFFDSD